MTKNVYFDNVYSYINYTFTYYNNILIFLCIIKQQINIITLLYLTKNILYCPICLKTSGVDRNSFN